MERNSLFKKESLVNLESVDIQLETGVYQTKSPCLTYEMFNKCPNKSDCPYYHGSFCKMCFQYCLPTWNRTARQVHLSQCFRHELQRKRWKEAEMNIAKFNEETRKREQLSKLHAIHMIERAKMEQKKIFFKANLPNFYQKGKV